jgi:hypothetical protein
MEKRIEHGRTYICHFCRETIDEDEHRDVVCLTHHMRMMNLPATGPVPDDLADDVRKYKGSARDGCCHVGQYIVDREGHRTAYAQRRNCRPIHLYPGDSA